MSCPEGDNGMVAESAALVDEVAQMGAQLSIWRPPGAIADHRVIGGDNGAGPTLAQLQLPILDEDPSGRL